MIYDYLKHLALLLLHLSKPFLSALPSNLPVVSHVIRPDLCPFLLPTFVLL